MEPQKSGIGASIQRLAVLGIFFLIGGIFAGLDLEPMKSLLRGFHATLTLVEESTQTRPDLLRGNKYRQDGVRVNDTERSAGGLIVIQGLLPDSPQVRLLDRTGREIHRWEVDFFSVWPDPRHVVPPENIPISKHHYHTQGFVVHPDGSLLVNVSDKGAVMLDKCGNVKWTVDRMTHHHIARRKAGGYLIAAHMPIDTAPARLLPPYLTPDATMAAAAGYADNTINTILRLDDDGGIVQEIVILDALMQAGLDDVVFDGWRKRPLDPTHLNDIVEVEPALALKIPGVEVGDLLVSLRSLNMLAILDKDDGTLKWHHRGPWIRQHDPDIDPDGTIVVFDNRLKPDSGVPFTGSRLVRLDPATGATEVLHPKGEQDQFYTNVMGAHQLLPNGNRLILESMFGRVFEVTPEGEVVWDYVLHYEDVYAALIENMERLPDDYFTVTDWSCGG